MALLFGDSFDTGQTAQLTQKYASVASGNTIVPSVGQCGTQALQQVQTPSTDGVIPLLAAAPSGATCNFMVAVNVPGGNVNPMTLLTIWNGSTPIHRVFINMDGSFTALRNPDAAFPPVVYTTPGGLVAHGQLVMVGVKTVLSNNDNTGSVQIQVNGTTVYTGSGINTSFDGPTWTNCGLGGRSANTQTIIFDSFVVGDGTGSGAQTGLLGTFQVNALVATGVGATTNFAVVGAANNWNVSSNNTPTPGSVYVKSSTVGNIDTYVYSDVPVIAGGTVYGVQVGILASEVSAGTRDVRAIVRQGGSNFDSGVDLGVPVTNPIYLLAMMQNNPATSAGWAFSEVNNDEFGVKLTV